MQELIFITVVGFYLWGFMSFQMFPESPLTPIREIFKFAFGWIAAAFKSATDLSLIVWVLIYGVITVPVTVLVGQFSDYRFAGNTDGGAWPLAILALTMIGCLILLFCAALNRFLRGHVTAVSAAATTGIATAFLVALFALWYSILWVSQCAIEDMGCNESVMTIGDAAYFSVVTWTTLGYGDFTPQSYVKILSALQAITGYLVMALLVSLLVLSAKTDEV